MQNVILNVFFFFFFFFFLNKITRIFTYLAHKNLLVSRIQHFTKIRLKTQPRLTRVKHMGKPGERWALRTLLTCQTDELSLHGYGTGEVTEENGDVLDELVCADDKNKIDSRDNGSSFTIIMRYL